LFANVCASASKNFIPIPNRFFASSSCKLAPHFGRS
jgi:hypothetical protein